LRHYRFGHDGRWFFAGPAWGWTPNGNWVPSMDVTLNKIA
jgi:hypothetical protein